MKQKHYIAMLALVLAVCCMFTACNSGGGNPGATEDPDAGYVNKTNHYKGYTAITEISEGMSWPDGQVVPTMATPAETLDAIQVGQLTDAEKTAMAVLQGHVNKTQPRIYLIEDKWHEEDALNLSLNMFDKNNKYELIAKYKDEITGLVLYNRKTSNHYINVACTIANLKGAIPVDTRVQEKLIEAGIELPVLEDLTSMTEKDPAAIYTYLYDNYWEQCQHRLLFSLSPTDHKFHTRDMAAATGGAVVWLDCLIPEQKAVYEKFLADMEPGNSLVAGWYTKERPGIGTTASYGLSTVPADYYRNSTVHAGMNHTIIRNAIPDKPELENKVYLAIFMSDGDNIQYCQGSMYDIWNDYDRGEIIINWTISPSLVDFGPAILNYYYRTATESDCLVSGPSGLGYVQIIDELYQREDVPEEERRDEDKQWVTDYEKFDKYMQLTQTYLERSGLRIITIWDLVNEQHRTSYATYARYLYGCTTENWRRATEPLYITQNMAFIANTPCYATTSSEIVNEFTAQIEAWDGNSPLFLTAQGNVWKMTPSTLNSILKKLNKIEGAEGKVELMRADHFFALLNESHNLPFDLSLSSKVTATATSNNDGAALTLDGNPTGDSIWVASEAGSQTITYDLGGTYSISRYLIRHAGDNGMDASLNTKKYTVEVSTDGENWTLVDDYRNNTANVTDIDIEPINASQVRITIVDAGSDGIARIADVEIYGSVVE